MIFNCTPHEVTVYNPSDCDFSNPRKPIVDDKRIKPLQYFAPCGVILNAHFKRDVFKLLGNVPIYRIDKVNVESPTRNFIKLKKTDGLIVSSVYRAAYEKLYPQTKLTLFVPEQTVYSADTGRVCGCLGLSIN